MTPQQKQIIFAAQERGGRITKREINTLYADCYYCNGEKHLGEILSRMVKSGQCCAGVPGRVFSPAFTAPGFFCAQQIYVLKNYLSHLRHFLILALA